MVLVNIILNPDYTLTINYTNGTSYTTTSIRGATGIKGDKGDAFTYSDFTQEQLASLKGDNGNEGHSPIVTAFKSGKITTIAVDGITIATISDGNDGQNGDDGNDGHTPIITASKLNGVTSINVDGAVVATINDGSNGDKGDKGNDGHTPVITAFKSNGVTSIFVDGTVIATINDGSKGDKGNDGDTPAITASKSGKTTTIYADGTSIATIADGLDGNNGDDGHSPVVTASKSGTVTTISVDGSSIATINDGSKGDTGESGVYIGTIQPSDPDVSVWIDPSGTGNDVLPSVTSQDNGKVLTVVNGSWNKAEVSGGSGSVFTFNVSWDSDAELYYADKTYREIYNAFIQGIPCICTQSEDGNGYYNHKIGIVSYVEDIYSQGSYNEHIYSIGIYGMNGLTCYSLDEYPHG